MPTRAPTIVAIDPGNTHLGFAAVLHKPGERMPWVMHLEAVSGLPDPLRTVHERVEPLVRRWANGTGDQLWIEQCPPMMREDVGHGAQAAIGFAQGWMSGLIAGTALARLGFGAVHLVEVAPWRDSMLRFADAHGYTLAHPTRKRPVAVGGASPFRFRFEGVADGGADRVWEGCNHRDYFLSMSKAMGEAPPLACPTCAKSRKAPADAAEAVRDAWKETACLFVARFWPRQYDAVVNAARKRARTPKPDHQLAGVADACEAVGIAIHGLSKLEVSP